ncbi:hypothetical protein RN001_003450 [Aquatica leii]|uniref:Small ribosomal subunit protein uS12m n=1 Tax=Aquatica leii TaxID=1421715 RepID=A0AAN7Q6B8_9COLE|nr:hypothetical protein RN001_003450 [Aquatica leii]
MSSLKQLLSKSHQVIFTLTVCYLIFGSIAGVPIKIKRAPLEVGLISFNDAPKYLSHKTNLTKHRQRNSVKTGHSQHMWIPGYVRDHAFIPAHEEHVFIPTHEVIIAQPIHSILVQSNNVYKSHPGGFGVGVNFGGRGTGHGFHISTNNVITWKSLNYVNPTNLLANVNRQLPLFTFYEKSMASLAQMHRSGPHMKVRKSKNPLDGNPFMKGVVLKTLIKKPKKPNSANRKCVLVRLSNGKEMVAYIPGIGHNLQEHNIVLVRVGRVQDCPGVKLKCVRGKYDLSHMNVTPMLFQNMLKLNNNNEESRYSEPIDCSNSILDLCTRRQPRSPSPENDSKDTTTTKHTLLYTETPTSTVGISSPGSETSDISTSSDLYRDIQVKTLQPILSPKVKVPRPFKAYPKDPLSLAAAECVLGRESTEAYTEFRKRMLAQVHASNGITNKNMRRVSPGNNNHNRDDASYWEKRRKNNEAAKRSRDARRAKEDELAIRAAFLERENLHLRCEVANMRIELEELRTVVYRRPVV